MHGENLRTRVVTRVEIYQQIYQELSSWGTTGRLCSGERDATEAEPI